MKTKKVLKTIDVMTESVVKELNDMSEKIDNKANHSYVQTIAKHVMNLESRVEELEKEQKSECYHTPLSVIEFILNPPYDTNPQTDYFLKAKNLLIDYAESTMIKKGMEYTPIGDRFANFRPILGEKKTAIEKLIGYNAKHVQYCFMQSENPSYPSDTYKRKNTPIGIIFGYGELKKYQESIDNFIEYYNLSPSKYPVPAIDYITGCLDSGQLESFTIGKTTYLKENKEYYKQCYINELLEHWGDVFNYNVLGLAMRNTDKEPYYIVPYADRETQEKEIKSIVDSVKNNPLCNLENRNTPNDRYLLLLTMITQSNLFTIIYLFAKQLERLEGK